MNEQQQRLLSKVDRDEAWKMAQEIVAIPSHTGEEQAVADYVAERFSGLGLDVRMQEVEPGRSNVICTLKGTGGGRSLLFNGHMDTSIQEIKGWENVYTDGDWLFGPGATNMKGYFPAAYAAVKALLDSGSELKGDIVVTGVVGEIEQTAVKIGDYVKSGPAYRGCGLGTEHMLRHGVIGDMAIIGEPTGLRVQCGNAGYIYAQVTTYGKVIHTHSKHTGVNALDKILPVAQAIRDWEPEYQRIYEDPYMKPLLLLGGMFAGKPEHPNNTCGTATLLVHFTTVPGLKPTTLKRQLQEVVARAGAGDPEFKADVSFYQIRHAYQIPLDDELPTITRQAHEAIHGSPPDPIEPTRYSVSSDGSFFQVYGVPSITYGPGGLTRRGARRNRDEVTGHEGLSLENLANCARVYALTALDVCGQDAPAISTNGALAAAEVA